MNIGDGISRRLLVVLVDADAVEAKLVA